MATLKALLDNYLDKNHKNITPEHKKHYQEEVLRRLNEQIKDQIKKGIEQMIRTETNPKLAKKLLEDKLKTIKKSPLTLSDELDTKDELKVIEKSPSTSSDEVHTKERANAIRTTVEYFCKDSNYKSIFKQISKEWFAVELADRISDCEREINNIQDPNLKKASTKLLKTLKDSLQPKGVSYIYNKLHRVDLSDSYAYKRLLNFHTTLKKLNELNKEYEPIYAQLKKINDLDNNLKEKDEELGRVINTHNALSLTTSSLKTKDRSKQDEQTININIGKMQELEEKQSSIINEIKEMNVKKLDIQDELDEFIQSNKLDGKFIRAKNIKENIDVISNKITEAVATKQENQTNHDKKLENYLKIQTTKDAPKDAQKDANESNELTILKATLETDTAKINTLTKEETATKKDLHDTLNYGVSKIDLQNAKLDALTEFENNSKSDISGWKILGKAIVTFLKVAVVAVLGFAVGAAIGGALTSFTGPGAIVGALVGGITVGKAAFAGAAAGIIGAEITGGSAALFLTKAEVSNEGSFRKIKKEIKDLVGNPENPANPEDNTNTNTNTDIK